jgi:hypothetical protein
MIGPITRLLVPSYRPARPPSKMVAIVVPGSTREALTEDEAISLRHLRHFLALHDKFFIVPRGSGFRLEGLTSIEIDRKFFGSAQAHGRLTYSRDFYRHFEGYRYILMYHLDALVFRDELLQWCETGVDYIGAPWIPCKDSPWVTEPAVGNGGFALMKIASVLEVLHNRYRQQPARYWEDRFAKLVKVLPGILRWPKRLLPHAMQSRIPRQLGRALGEMEQAEVNVRNNDLFWSFHAAKFMPGFCIPDWRTGLRFAFETPPRECFELNGRQLPFGCHAWPKYDRAFWEPHLLRA